MIYQLALFGHPVKHSQSPQIHQEFARQFGLDIKYQLIDVTTDELHRRVHQFFDQGGHGANVTVPHKQAVMTVTDQLTERATQAGAVNTLYLKDNQLWGDNTDGIGLVKDLQQKNIDLRNKRILIFGAGGAVHGVLPALLQQNPGSIDIYNRSQAKAEQLAEKYDLITSLTKPALLTGTVKYELIINGTGCGHAGISPPIPHNLPPKTVAYDLSYGAVTEPFMHACQLAGLKHVFAGLGMLRQQAAYAFKQWFDRYPNVNKLK